MTDILAKTRVAIIGTGGMARAHVAAYQNMAEVELVAGVDTNETSLNQFCSDHNIEHKFSSVAELVSWGKFDAVSNVTPDSVHYVTSMELIAAQKHILCEKPLATNFQHADEMSVAATKAGIINMVNLSYRNVGVIEKAATMVRNGDIGIVKHLEASYLQSWLVQPAWGDWKTEQQWLWRLSKDHGSKGVLGDVGVHILDFATYVAGSMPKKFGSQIHTFHKAEDDKIGEYKLDANDSFVMQFQLENGALGTVSATRFAAGHINDLRLRIFGDKGGLEIDMNSEDGEIRACLGDNLEVGKWQTIDFEPVKTNYQKFIDAVRTKNQCQPDFKRGADLQKILDAAEAKAI